MTGEQILSDREIFRRAIQLPLEQRAPYLDQACNDDAELRQEVESLLQAHDTSNSFMKMPALELSAEAVGLTAGYQSLVEGPGTIIGPYRLLQQIGEGGMGVVFMAEQTVPLQRTVALKIIKPGMDTRQVIARFEAERQALAMMDHPNIARVMDAGTTESGRPYFVMELVKGVPITDYCVERRLPLRDRLVLFVTVCRAIQHAHQKGIIHRDLKPSNVLAAPHDGHPVPKIIDFGVAKATGPKLTERTLFTEFGAVLGTLEYMSPEQAELNQLDIDTRSDIYGLGVLLYELLTGTTPLGRERLKETSLVDILRVIREEEPPRPSARLTAAQQSPATASNRASTSTEFSALLRGELDWVVMKALEKDRNRRYQTANSLALDLERYLANEPVEAAPPSATYRLRKFAVRNKAAMMTAALVAASLLAGTVISVWQATLAQSRLKSEQAARQQATAEARTKATTISLLLEQMLSLANPSAAKGTNYTVRQMLDEFATGLGSRLRDQPEAEAAIRSTIGNAYRGLQSFDNAEPHLKAALDARVRLFGPVHAEVAQSLVDYSTNLYGRGRIVEAEKRAREALAIHRQLTLQDSAAMRVLSTLQLYLMVQGRFKEANDIAQEALEIAGRNPKLHPEEAIVLHNLAHAAVHQGDPAKAEQLARRSVALHQTLHGAKHPETAHALFILAGSLHAQLNFDEAATCFRDVLAIQRTQFDDSQTPVLAACAGLADTLRAKGDQAGLNALRAAIDLTTFQPDEWESWYFRGSFLAALSDWELAGAAFAKAAERESDPGQARYLYYLGLVRLANHDLAGYRETCERLIECAERLETPSAAELAAWACLLAPESVADPGQLEAFIQRSLGGVSNDPRRLAALGAAYYRAGLFDEARHLLVQVIEAAPAESTDLRMVTYSQLFLAMAQQRLRRPKEAQHWLKQATQAIDQPATIAQKKLSENWDTILPLQLLRQEAERMLVAGDDDRTTTTVGRN